MWLERAELGEAEPWVRTEDAKIGHEAILADPANP